MKNRLWKVPLGLVVLFSAGLGVGVEPVVYGSQSVLAQEMQQDAAQTITGRLSAESETLEDGSYYNVHAFDAEAGQTFRIEMVSDEFDTYLMVFDAEGNKLAENNDSENGTNAQVSVTISATGQYVIIANSFEAGETGDYTLIIRATQSEAISQEPNQSAAKAEADRLLQQGIQQFRVSQFREALAFWEAALQIYREIGDRQGEASSLCNLGATYSNLGQYEVSIDYLKQSLAIAHEIGDRLRESSALGNLGIAYENLGQYGTAIDYHEQYLSIARDIGDRQGEVNALGNLGLAYFSLGQYERAIDYHEQALNIAREISYLQGEASVLGNLGLAYRSLGQYERAIDYHEQALAIARDIGDRQGEANALGSLGLAYKSLGQYETAIGYHEQYLSIARDIGDRQGEANALGNLGLAYRSLGQYERAIDYHEQSLAIAREIGDRQGEAASLGSLGIAYDRLGQYERAIDYHEQYLSIAREIGDRQGEANALGNLGNAYFSLEQYERAIDYLEQQLAITHEIGDRQGEAYSLNNLGSAYLDTKQYVNAEIALLSAVDVFEELRTSGLPDADKVSLFETQRISYMLLQQALVAQNTTNAALEIAERSRARALVELIATQVSARTAEEVAVTIPSLAEIQQVAQRQNATLVSYSIINLDIGDPVLYVWAIPPDGEIYFDEIDLSTLDRSLGELVTRSRDALGVRGLGFDGNLASVPSPEDLQRQREAQNRNLKQLYDILIAPIANQLPTDANEKVIFIPQGDLFLVPFAALIDENGQYLIENHTISIAPSIQTLELTHQLSSSTTSLTANPLIVGNPTMPKLWNPNSNTDERLPALIGAENEAEAIAQQLNTEALLWDNASETVVAAQMPNASLIHFATHGLLDYGTPEESGVRDVPGAIALAPDSTNDGLLTSAEIFEMQLQAELVVLSACNTGRGTITGDGVIGLSRSLMQAGVPSVVVSLWSVPDDSTEFLMTEFYANLNTMDKTQALRQAMLTTMQNPEYTEPLDWAAFTLVGEPE